MTSMDERREDATSEATAQPFDAERELDDARLAMMRDVKRMPLEERLALLDRLCREGTQIAIHARRLN